MPRPVSDVGIVNQYKADLTSANSQHDGRGWRTMGSVPQWEALAKLRQHELRNMKLKKTILFVLMPELKMRRQHLNPLGTQDFERSTLKPLADDGTIILHDYSNYFDETPAGEYSAFWDALHRNTEGQRLLTDALLPLIKSEIYKIQAN